MVSPSGWAQSVITTAAGSGIDAFGGDGGPATSAWMLHPAGVAVDAAGNLYICDAGNFRVRKVTPSGTISTFAGNGSLLFSGDNVQATTTALFLQGTASCVATDGFGNVYIADTSNNRIRKVDSSGIITTVAGTGLPFFSGDGGPATSAAIGRPGGVAVDQAGNI